MRSPIPLIAVIIVSGCATFAARDLDEHFGKPDPARYDAPGSAVAGPDTWPKTKDILDNRCVGCHACADAPCQLNLASYQGLTRGASKDRVYNPVRLTPDEPTRMFLDAQTNVEWRRRGFYPVLNERTPTAVANRQGSVLQRILDLKRRNPLPLTAPLSEKRFDLSLQWGRQCPAIEEFDEFEQRHADWGMPYGLPALSDAEQTTLTRWIEAGGPYRDPLPLPAAYQHRIGEWERFLNGDSLKSQLASRYIYEHWFLAHLYFDDLPAVDYFELVRSRTPSGEPIDVIATVRPYDDPGVPRVYYRLRRVQSTIVAKTHMPMALNARYMARLRTWFMDAPFEVTALPSYDPGTSANPFATFQQLPNRSRYRFMLDNAQFTIMGFIKSPVCRGQIALNVINDYYWVVFADPEADGRDLDTAQVSQALVDLRLPGENDGTGSLFDWRTYSALETRYLDAKTATMNREFAATHPVSLSLLWDGNGVNPNAALTIFRHFDSASVVQGLVGPEPQTAWLIGYPLLERIHYLLVAGYDVYGNVGHQLSTRLYMDFLRMEGEFNFLTLLPKASRTAVVDHWYRGVSQEEKDYLGGRKAYFDQESGVQYGPGDPLPQLYGQLRHKFEPLSDRRFELETSGLGPAGIHALRALDAIPGVVAARLPPVGFLTVRSSRGRSYHFTLIENVALTNVADMFREDDRRIENEDTLLVVNGFIGAHPNAFYSVTEAELPAFVVAVQGLASEENYRALVSHFGVSRTDRRFWSEFDQVQAAYQAWQPIEAGVLDLGRLENR